MNQMEVGIINYNGGEELVRCVKSLTAQSFPSSFMTTPPPIIRSNCLNSRVNLAKSSVQQRTAATQGLAMDSANT